MKSRVNDVGKVLTRMKVFSCRAMRMNVKRRLYEGVALPTSAIWSMTVVEKKLSNVMEIGVCGVCVK